ncbi:MAG: endopeptidase La [Thermodesulfobacteriota bacterium]
MNPIVSDDAEPSERDIPEQLPVMAVRDVVVFNYMILPLFVGRNASVSAVNDAMAKDKLLMLVTQRDASLDEPGINDVYDVGMVCMVMRTLKLPDGRLKVLVQALHKARVVEYVQETPHFIARIEVVADEATPEITVEIEALMRNVREQTEKILALKGIMSSDLMVILNNVEEPGRLADLVVSNLQLKVAESQSVLETFEPVARLRKVAEFLQKELEVSTMQAKIQSEAKEEMSRSQREYYLREQLHALKKELGDIDERSQEIEELRERFTKGRMPGEVKKEGLKQLKRLEMMHPDASEAAIIRTYLDWLLDVPWRKSTKDRLDLKVAKEVLDADHYGLDKVKERILEYLAVRKLNKATKGPILCFVGPPGVGKTSLGQSIARAMGRKFHRLSLGGMRDEAEIRGHRRTYIGAMPGRIIQGLKTVGSNNPVFMMDEIDKVGADYRGDPSSALLEVLDPAQNTDFSDHYLNLPCDLSKVMFITTANMTDTIPAPLLDRMEVIRLAGYTQEEKIEIAKRYLLPRQLAENGITARQLQMDDAIIARIITHYTREAGLRNLEREIGSVCRKVARKVAEGGKGPYAVSVRTLSQYLGPPKFLPESETETIDQPGMATGLAWTEVGGEILYVEVSIVKGRGNLTMTGQLGDVMKESAQAAASFCRSLLGKLKLKDNYFDEVDIHVHVPAGAIPKDGPSAGVTIATALYSALARKTVRQDIAMTGEITLRGRVLPIGGLKEKALAALRAGITTVIIPDQNQKDLVEIPKDLRDKIRFVPVKNMDQILSLVFRKK